MTGAPRRARAVIRAPNHLGELVLALPALGAAARSWPSTPLVQVVDELVPVLRMAGVDAEILPLRGRHRVVRAARALRRRRPDAGFLLTPSFSAALIFALAGVRSRRGTATDARTLLLTDAVDRGPLLRGHRVREYLELVDAREPGEADAPPAPRLRRLDRARSAWRELAAREDVGRGGGPVVGLVPGANAPARRWPAQRFAGLAGRLAAAGCEVRVFGAPGEEEVTARVAGAVGEADDLGGRTDLYELVGGLESCDAVVANDTGAAHVAAALDRPLVVVWGSGDPRQTRPPGPDVRIVGRGDLPCHPCLGTACPRRGAGFRSADGRRECLTLVGVDEVEAAVLALLGAGRDAAADGAGAGRSPDAGRERGGRHG